MFALWPPSLFERAIQAPLACWFAFCNDFWKSDSVLYDSLLRQEQHYRRLSLVPALRLSVLTGSTCVIVCDGVCEAGVVGPWCHCLATDHPLAPHDITDMSLAVMGSLRQVNRAGGSVLVQGFPPSLRLPGKSVPFISWASHRPSSSALADDGQAESWIQLCGWAGGRSRARCLGKTCVGQPSPPLAHTWHCRGL